MIPIASPLASEPVEEVIAKLISEQAERSTLSTGIKKCQKRILEGSKGLLVLTADTTPMDLITHLPALCEDRGVKYIFVRKKSSIPGRFTCVFLEMDGGDASNKITEALM
ncbi:ribosomal protein L7Ae [Encephalitozoon hellem]|nr:ribosomal protein L7Ae [Encephalitozoon hellem]